MPLELVTEADVINAYRFILGREPENYTVVQDKLATCLTFSALRSNFINSFEFRSKFGSHDATCHAKKKHIDLLPKIHDMISLSQM